MIKNIKQKSKKARCFVNTKQRKSKEEDKTDNEQQVQYKGTILFKTNSNKKIYNYVQTSPTVVRETEKQKIARQAIREEV